MVLRAPPTSSAHESVVISGSVPFGFLAHDANWADRRRRSAIRCAMSRVADECSRRDLALMQSGGTHDHQAFTSDPIRRTRSRIASASRVETCTAAMAPRERALVIFVGLMRAFARACTPPSGTR